MIYLYISINYFDINSEFSIICVSEILSLIILKF